MIYFAGILIVLGSLALMSLLNDFDEVALAAGVALLLIGLFLFNL
jgi:hypothetical protein